MCRSGKAGQGGPVHARWVTTESEERLYVRNPSASGPYQVELSVNGHPLTMEVDTGAGVSIAPESALSAMLPSMELQESSVLLKTHTGQSIIPLDWGPEEGVPGRE